MPIGLFFGSFNPIHVGHLIIANHVLNETEIKKIWFVISPQNPFKQSAGLLNEFDRLHLIQKAVAPDSRLKAVDIEFSLPKPSYTSATLTYLKEKYPSQNFQVIIGSDSFQNLKSWKNSDFLIKNYQFLVYERPGFVIRNDIGAMIIIMKAPLLEISSTYIRQLIQQRKSIRYLVPESIEEEILTNRFFQVLKK